MAKPKSQKKKTKLRKNIRYDSLNIAKVTRVRKEFIDYDPAFLKKLKREDPEAYAYLAAFVDEYENASIPKTASGKVKAGYLHNTTELAKERYDANNHRNNDVYGVTKANHILSDIEKEIRSNDGWYVNRADLTEQAMLADIEQDDEHLSYEEYQELKHTMTPEMILFYECLYAEEEN